MSVNFKKLPNGGVIFKASGILTGPDTIALNKELYSDPEFAGSIRYQIVDLLEVSDFAMSPSEMQILARQDMEVFAMNPKMIIAIVMNDDLAYGMHRIYAAYFHGDGESVCLFKDMQEAKDWIRTKLPDTNP